MTTSINIPPPMRRGRQRKNPLIYDALCAMKVGDSIKFERQIISDIRNVTRYLALRGAAKFATRKLDDTTIQVWRIK